MTHPWRATYSLCRFLSPSSPFPPLSVPLSLSLLLSPSFSVSVCVCVVWCTTFICLMAANQLTGPLYPTRPSAVRFAIPPGKRLFWQPPHPSTPWATGSTMCSVPQIRGIAYGACPGGLRFCSLQLQCTWTSFAVPISCQSLLINHMLNLPQCFCPKIVSPPTVVCFSSLSLSLSVCVCLCLSVCFLSLLCLSLTLYSC